MAVEYRNLFKRDIFIDLISYRRHGHNEADEPLATQPMMYASSKNILHLVKSLCRSLDFRRGDELKNKSPRWQMIIAMR